LIGENTFLESCTKNPIVKLNLPNKNNAHSWVLLFSHFYFASIRLAKTRLSDLSKLTIPKQAFSQNLNLVAFENDSYKHKVECIHLLLTSLVFF
jgi:hypothetical protein